MILLFRKLQPCGVAQNDALITQKQDYCTSFRALVFPFHMFVPMFTTLAYHAAHSFGPGTPGPVVAQLGCDRGLHQHVPLRVQSVPVVGGVNVLVDTAI